MFDFEKLIVYQKSKATHKKLTFELRENKLIQKSTFDQVYRASESIILNIAEGAGKYSPKEKRNFYVIARASTFECVAILQILLDQKIISQTSYQTFYNNFEEIAKMLSRMIKNLG